MVLSTAAAQAPGTLRIGIAQVLALAVVTATAILVLVHGTARLSSEADATTYFKGTSWTHPGMTSDRTELLSAAHLRVESHGVNTQAGVVAGWLWVDFYDRVDVLVEASDGDFRVLRQQK